MHKSVGVYLRTELAENTAVSANPATWPLAPLKPWEQMRKGTEPAVMAHVLCEIVCEYMYVQRWGNEGINTKPNTEDITTAEASKTLWILYRNSPTKDMHTHPHTD